jgi:hypothetical protein
MRHFYPAPTAVVFPPQHFIGPYVRALPKPKLKNHGWHTLLPLFPTKQHDYGLAKDEKPFTVSERNADDLSSENAPEFKRIPGTRLGMVLLSTLEVIAPTSLGDILENEGLYEPGTTKLGIITTSSKETRLSFKKLTRVESTLLLTSSFYSMDYDPSDTTSGQRTAIIPFS